MARRYDVDYGYSDVGDDFRIIERDVVDQIRVDQVERPLDEVTPDQITADQNNYSLPAATLVRLSTDASRTFTGFAGARAGIFIVCNVGTVAGRDVVIANDSPSSDAENRVLCHTGANITLNINESVSMTYDFTLGRWRTVGFV